MPMDDSDAHFLCVVSAFRDVKKKRVRLAVLFQAKSQFDIIEIDSVFRMRGVSIDHGHGDIASFVPADLHDAHRLIEPKVRVGRLTVEATVHREKVLLRPERMRDSTRLVLLGDGKELGVA